jgi:hypothetical protein
MERINQDVGYSNICDIEWTDLVIRLHTNHSYFTFKVSTECDVCVDDFYEYVNDVITKIRDDFHSDIIFNLQIKEN